MLRTAIGFSIPNNMKNNESAMPLADANNRAVEDRTNSPFDHKL